MKPFIAIVFASFLAVAVAKAQQGAATVPATQQTVKFNLWLYWHTGLVDDGNLAKSIDMLKRMKKAGYTGIAYLDNRLHRPALWDAKFEGNLEKFRQACSEQQMDLVAAVLPLGYANDIMTADPNLAEAIPVVDAPFVVKDGKLVPSDDLKLVNGDFSDNKDNKPAGWGVDKPGVGCFIDTEVKYKGKPTLRMEDIELNGEAGHLRAWQQLKVKPFRAYHMSVAVRTEKYLGHDTRLMALGSTEGKEHSGRMLNQPGLHTIKSDQEWMIYHKTFNTQDCDHVAIYVGDWAGKAGRIWFADVTLEPAGLTNVVRRDGAPVRATVTQGKTVLAEGKDIPQIVDPNLGKSGHIGGYLWHESPTPAIPATSHLKDGDKVFLSYATTHVMEYNDQVPICMAEPKGYELIDKIVEHTQKHLRPDFWFMEHDEIRMQGWDKSCTDTGKTPGGILADNIGKCTTIIRKHSPAAKGIYVWSDMFDPFHNAGHKGEYYAVNKGINPYDKSWEGLPKQVGLINWNSAKAESVEFFAREGHPQVFSAPNADVISKILEKSGAQKGVSGCIYVTWSGDFGPNVERFAAAVHVNRNIERAK